MFLLVIGILIGFFIGGLAGIFTTALIIAGKRDDERAWETYADETETNQTDEQHEEGSNEYQWQKSD